jgi:4-diphosphocytidyl-2-C-methyl-D-erythritol kinase
VIVKPKIHIGTSEAYAGIRPAFHLFSVKELIEKSMDEWQHTLKNDFEKSIFILYPEIEKIKNTFYENGASYASMSGSGSSVFALFKNSIDLSSQFEDNFYWSSKI